MTRKDNPPAPQVWPTLWAQDARALIRFLVDVVGFEETAVYGEGDTVHHAELAWPPGGGIHDGLTCDTDGPWAQKARQTFAAYVVADDIDGLYERCAVAGADIMDKPHDTDYGSRDFALRDPEGNRWSFGTYRGARKNQ